MKRFISRPDDPFKPLWSIVTYVYIRAVRFKPNLLRSPCVCTCMCPAAPGSHWPKWECAAAAGHWGLLNVFVVVPARMKGSLHLHILNNQGLNRMTHRWKKRREKKRNHRFNKRPHWLCVYRVCAQLSARSDASLLRLAGAKKARAIIWRIL